MERTVTLSDFRERPGEALQACQDGPVTILEHGRPVAHLLAADARVAQRLGDARLLCGLLGPLAQLAPRQESTERPAVDRRQVRR